MDFMSILINASALKKKVKICVFVFDDDVLKVAKLGFWQPNNVFIEITRTKTTWPETQLKTLVNTEMRKTKLVCYFRRDGVKVNIVCYLGITTQL